MLNRRRVSERALFQCSLLLYVESFKVSHSLQLQHRRDTLFIASYKSCMLDHPPKLYQIHQLACYSDISVTKILVSIYTFFHNAKV